METVKHAMENNGFYAHIECVLLCMVMDPRPKVNEKAIEMIKKRRETDDLINGKVREFHIPPINYKAKSYEEMIDFDKYPHDYSSPPILAKYSIEQIQKKEFDDDFYKIRCHSQAVERAVYLTSQAAEKVIGYDARHGWILNKLKQVEKFPTDSTKEHFAKAALTNE